MTKSQTQVSAGRARGFTLSVLVGLAVVGCGERIVAGSGGNQLMSVVAAPFCVAPIEGSPEEAALALGHCSSGHVAPIDGSPEQTAAEMNP